MNPPREDFLSDPVEHKVHLPKPLFLAPDDRKRFRAQSHGFRIVNQDLAPNIDQNAR